MNNVSERAKIFYLLMIIIFVFMAGFFWLDYIGLINLNKELQQYYKREIPLVIDSDDDEPSLIEREEFNKEKKKLLERIDELDKREAEILEKEKKIAKEREELEEIRNGLDIEKKRQEEAKKRYSGYSKNVIDLAQKIASMRPDEAVQIMIKWEEPLLIDVLRQMDINAEEAGQISITSYLISLMPREKASQIMYLMTQI
ncbi:MAG: hypothetical protein SVZ03_01155 [Spirochaetota bacterium]|nr:hypothetical protein [Spirochaetota bacterium]